MSKRVPTYKKVARCAVYTRREQQQPFVALAAARTGLQYRRRSATAIVLTSIAICCCRFRLIATDFIKLRSTERRVVGSGFASPGKSFCGLFRTCGESRCACGGRRCRTLFLRRGRPSFFLPFFSSSLPIFADSGGYANSTKFYPPVRDMCSFFRNMWNTREFQWITAATCCRSGPLYAQAHVRL